MKLNSTFIDDSEVMPVNISNETGFNIPAWSTTILHTILNGTLDGINQTTVNEEEDGPTLTSSGLPVDSFLNILIAIVLAILILTTAIGNVFVIAVILLERHLQSVANYLILSLAVADLLVACLVMPLGAVYQVTGKWLLGPELCDMWTSSDVLCCTASILHLVAIATDRYWAVTSVDYIHRRTFARINVMILLVWGVSGLVSCFPLFGWKDPDWHQRIQYQQCLISQDVGYQVFATLSTFYLPLAIILFLYWRIFVTAKKRIRRRKPQAGAGLNLGRGAMSSAAPTTSTSQGVSMVTAETACTIASAMAAAVGVLELGRPPIEAEESTMTAERSGRPPSHRTIMRRNTSVAAVVAASAQNKRRNMRERKAAKTLAIITGAFVVCWLPFFVIALLMPLCSDCHFDDNMVAFFLWLGYFNSTLNPILYTIFSPEFRNAFTKLLRLNRPSGGQRQPGRSQQLQTAGGAGGGAPGGGNNNKLNDLVERQSICSG